VTEGSTQPTLTLVPPPAETPTTRRTSITVTAEFGPPRSRFFAQALDHARAGGDELAEIRPGRFRAVFVLGSDPGAFAHLGALCRLIRHWRGTTVEADGLPVPATVARDMGFCGADQLRRHGECRIRGRGPVPARCGPCPLFDPAPLAPQAPPTAGGTSVRPVVPWGFGPRRRRRPRLRVVREGDRGRARPTRFVVVVPPSRSWDAQRALDRARTGATRVVEGPDGSWRAEFVLQEDRAVATAIVTTLRHLLMVRGTEVWVQGLPVSPGQAMGIASRMPPTYRVPPPRDLVSLLVDDLTDADVEVAGSPAEGWEDPWTEE
jgi:hypothetical protein